ncbi:2,4-dienoyl-CoA reductase [Jannaschia faecimaris]|uniref:2,4-dienoyl-CoA reductase n=2 Tax=Jannaschia faecimaris TaxID=1244108 RepID=A0A1H3RZT7_9RHOB|nr:2,4-dienoyl-CoA reductase [Jannaschia faecimaris]
MTALFRPLTLPCGVVLKNRLVKSAMSDSLGDGRGNPCPVQARLYERWAEGGVAVSIIGEVQGDPSVAEKPGNLVLGPSSDEVNLRDLTRRGATNGAQLWAQLGHAGAMAHPPISRPRGPSALNISGLNCDAMTEAEITALPAAFARTAAMAKRLGFGGVQVHAAHGFLLSQFLSPLFNQRSDAWGGSLSHRMRLTLEVVEAVRAAVGTAFPVAIKLNATDQLEGGFEQAEALEVISALDATTVDLIDISGGTYFPGAASASDRVSSGPYFLEFAAKARPRTAKPLMLNGGVKTRAQAVAALDSGAVDVIGLARALVLDPVLPRHWQDNGADPAFPRFTSPPEGGVTAWYTMQMTALAEGTPGFDSDDLAAAIDAYDQRDAARTGLWREQFAR